MTAPSQYLSVQTAADRLDCSPITIRRMISRGELKASRFGRLIRITETDLAKAARPVTNAATLRATTGAAR